MDFEPRDQRTIATAGRRLSPPSGLIISLDSVLVGGSLYMQRKRHECLILGPFRSITVIEGETGTGKGQVLEELFRHYALRYQPARMPLRVSAPQFNNEVAQSHLFGHDDAAFSGARRRKAGLIKDAQDSFLFLDDADDLDPPGQGLVLDVFDDKPLRSMGDSGEFELRARLIVGIKKPLRELVAAGTFRRDLAARLDGPTIRLLPLREHSEDIPALASHMLPQLARAFDLPASDLSDAALELLTAYRWPENIRELRKVLESALYEQLLCGETGLLDVHHLPLKVRGEPRRRRARISLERSDILAALRSCDGVVTHAAERLAVSKRTLERRIRDLAVDVSRFRR